MTKLISISCKTCRQKNVGPTVERFQLRCKISNKNDSKTKRGEEHMQPELFDHFHSEKHDGFLQDCSTTLTDKTDGSGPRRREEYWCAMLKTVAPCALMG